MRQRELDGQVWKTHEGLELGYRTTQMFTGCVSVFLLAIFCGEDSGPGNCGSNSAQSRPSQFQQFQDIGVASYVPSWPRAVDALHTSVGCVRLLVSGAR